MKKLEKYNYSIYDVLGNNIYVEKMDNYWLMYENYKMKDYKIACFSNIVDILAEILRRTINDYKEYINVKNDFVTEVLNNIENMNLKDEEKNLITKKRYIKHY